MSGNKVSILVNCYNSEPYLKQALDSIYSQSHQNFEIILVDNCSTDRTAFIAKSYDQRLKYVLTEKNIPLYQARNVGLPYVTGDFLCFLDSDDYWFNDKLSSQLLIMSKTDYDFLYSNYRSLLEMGSSPNARLKKSYLWVHAFTRAFKTSREVNRTELIKKYDINLQTVMIRKRLFENMTFDSRFNLMGDLDFFFRLFWERHPKIYFDSSVTSVSRIHSQQLSRRNALAWLTESRQVLKKLQHLFTDEQRQMFKKFFVLFYYSSTLLERGETARGLRIKRALALCSAAFFMHYAKTQLLYLRSPLS